VKREEADRLAHAEYAVLEDRRRLTAEAVGEAEIMKQLERAGQDAAQVKAPAHPRKERDGK
jgi:hypothetical protein